MGNKQSNLVGKSNKIIVDELALDTSYKPLVEVSNQPQTIGDLFDANAALLSKEQPVSMYPNLDKTEAAADESKSIPVQKTNTLEDIAKLHFEKGMDLLSLLPWTLPFKPKIKHKPQFGYYYAIDWYYTDFYVNLIWKFDDYVQFGGSGAIYPLSREIHLTFQHRGDCRMDFKDVIYIQKMQVTSYWKNEKECALCWDIHDWSRVSKISNTDKTGYKLNYQEVAIVANVESIGSASGKKSSKHEFNVFSPSSLSQILVQLVCEVETRITWRVNYQSDKVDKVDKSDKGENKGEKLNEKQSVEQPIVHWSIDK